MFAWAPLRSQRAAACLKAAVVSVCVWSLLVGCDDHVEPLKKSSRAESQTVSGKEETKAPRNRAQLVAKADELAIHASHEKQRSSSEFLVEAAELRELAYRSYAKKVDALEAIELWAAVALADPSLSCEAGLRTTRLKGQLGQEPTDQYRDLYLLQERFAEGSCRERTQRALAALQAFAPDPRELQELRDNARQLRAEAIEEEKAQAVVVPEVLRASLDQPTTITKVEPFGAEATARVVVHVTHPTKFEVGTLPGNANRDPRLFVDIAHASFDGPDELASEGLLKRVRLGKGKDSSRIVLDLAHNAHHRVFYLPEPFRLVIDLSSEAPESQANPRQIRRVVLDPGHGGHDPGAVAKNGLQEKDVALDIAHRAAPLLAREVGVSTLLTRDVDVFVPLDERAARANAFHADLFVSVHLNSSPDSSSRGVMTFVLDTSRDAAASKIAARENSSTEAAAVELANSLSRIESSSRRAASETFAQLLQRAAGVSLRQGYDDIADHGVRRAGFYVLAGAAMPAVLFEGSFLSNPVESSRLNNADYRQRLADSIVNAVRAYRQGL